MENISDYIRAWVTPTRLKLFGWKIRRELQTLNEKELGDTVEVLAIITGMVQDEVNSRNARIPA